MLLDFINRNDPYTSKKKTKICPSPSENMQKTKSNSKQKTIPEEKILENNYSFQSFENEYTKSIESLKSSNIFLTN